MLEELSNIDRAKQKARWLIEASQREIFATMDLAQELIDPLPDWYYQLMLEKLKEGIKITRIAFGSECDFLQFSSKHTQLSGFENYQCLLGGINLENYYRMLLTDREKLMFAVQIPVEFLFLFTDESKYIEKYEEYFSSLIKQGF
jgi:hypothetical protein